MKSKKLMSILTVVVLALMVSVQQYSSWADDGAKRIANPRVVIPTQVQQVGQAVSSTKEYKRVSSQVKIPSGLLGLNRTKVTAPQIPKTNLKPQVPNFSISPRVYIPPKKQSGK